MIIVSGLVAIALLWAALTYHLAVQRETVISQTHRDVRNLSSALSQQVERILVSVDQVMQFVQDDYAQDRGHFRFETWMERSTSLQTVASQVTWYDANGEFVVSRTPRPPDAPRFNVRDREYFRAQAERPDAGLYLDRTLVGRSSGTILFQMSRRLSEPDGRFAGVIVVSLDPKYFSDQFRAVDVGIDGSVALFGLDGYVRARQPEQPGMYTRNASSMNSSPGVFAHVKSSPVGSYRLLSAFDQTERILGYRTVGDLPLVVTVGKNLTEVLVPFEAERRRVLVVGLIATLALAAGVALVVRELERRRRRDTLLMQAETALRGVNDRLLLAEQIAQVGNWRLEIATQELKWSEQVYRIHGYDPATFVPTLGNAIAAYLQEDRDKVDTFVQTAMRDGKNFDFGMRIVQAGGAIRDVLCRGLCELDEAGQVTALFGTIMDVTDLRQAEREAAQTTSLLEATLDSMDQGLLVVSPEGRIEICNTRAAELLDLDPATMAERPTAQSLLDAQWASGEFAGADDTVLRMLRQGLDSVLTTSYTRVRPNGTVLEIGTMPMAGGGVVRTYSDITDRRAAEDALQASEARYRLLANNATDLIVLTHADGRPSYVSPALHAMLGYTLEDASAFNMLTLVHPEDLARVFAQNAALSAQQPTASIVYRLRHQDGHYIWVEAALKRVDDDGGAIVTAIRDVTERQRQARHLEQAKIAAEAGARTKAEFLANMSHELRTPLTGILGVHDLLQGEPDLTSRHKHFLGLAQESSRSLLRIVNDILDFSKIEAGQMTIERVPFGLRALVESCCALGVEMTRKPDVAIGTEFGPDVPDLLLGDPTRMRQVLLNLVSNALKFTVHGRVAIMVTRTADRLRVAVRDTGIGIAPDVIPQLFERFNQADTSTTRKFGGTGLGLAICKRLVELMNGAIGVESIPGEGSTFWIEIPLETAEPGPSPEVLNAARIGIADTRRRRILLADDNRVNNQIIHAALSRKGHEIVMVEDGGAVVEQFRSRSFDLVLMDIQMPVQDGLAATREIRRYESGAGRKATPIVALTANAMAEEVELCRRAGMDAHVAKPIDWPALFSTIERVCA